MATTNTPIYPQTIVNGQYQFTSSYTANTKETIFTAGANGAKVENIMVSSTNSAAAMIATLWVNAGTGTYQLAVFTIPENAGNVTNTPAMNLLAPSNLGLVCNTDAQGNSYLYLNANATLQLSLSAAPSSGKVVNVFAQGGSF